MKGTPILRRFLSLSAAFASIAAATAANAADEDTNIWLAQTASVDLGNDAVLWLEAQERFTNDASRLGQLLLRPAIGYRLEGGTTVFLGYAYVLTDPEGPGSTNEHRIFQQLSFRVLGDGGGVTLSGRTRLEQRFLEELSGTGWRLRQQVRLDAPLVGPVRAVLWTEPFIGLNDTGFQRDGVGLWRNYAGVAVPLNESLTLDVGYLNQHVNRTGPDRTDHTLSLGIGARF